MTKHLVAFIVLLLPVLFTGNMASAQGLRASPGLRMPEIGASPLAGNRAGSSQPQTVDFIVAVVNSEPITNFEIRSRMFRLEQQLQQQGQALPPRNELARQVLERLIADRAQVQAARVSGLRIEDSAVDLAVEGIAQQNQLSVEGLRRQLASDGSNFNQFRNELRDEMLLTRYRQREVESRITISEQEIDRFLREQQQQPAAANSAGPSAGSSRSTNGLALNLAEILVPVPETANPAQIAALQAQAQQIFERARQPNADFAALLREASTSAANPGRTSSGSSSGGETGLRPIERLPTLFVEATQNLRAGEVAGPLRSGAGFHVLKVIEKRQSGQTTDMLVTQNRARHILLRLGPQMTQEAAIAKLADFKKRIQAGQADFAALARESSDDGSAKAGGDLGWANPGMFVPEFENALNALAPGKIADPVVSRFGVHLIELLERRDAKLSPREQREAARTVLREQKLEEATVLWAQDIRGRAYVEIREAPR